MGKPISHSKIIQMAGRPLTQKEAMNTLLELMIAFDTFCDEHDLRYWLAGGTLLGAIRHQGFIPWDDDADIMMPREDYNKLMAFDKINDNIDIVSVLNDNGYYHPFVITKISAKDTISVIQDSERNTGRGQFVDIFPLDNIPDDVEERKRFFSMLSRCHRVRALAIRKIGKGKNLKSHIINILTRLMRPFSNLKYMRRIDRLAQKFNSAKTTKWGLVCYSVKDVFQWDICDFEDTIRVPFEGKMFCVPVGAKNILTHQYGDYMQLPPESQRVGKHDMKIFWKI